MSVSEDTQAWFKTSQFHSGRDNGSRVLPAYLVYPNYNNMRRRVRRQRAKRLKQLAANSSDCPVKNQNISRTVNSEHIQTTITHEETMDPKQNISQNHSPEYRHSQRNKNSLNRDLRTYYFGRNRNPTRYVNPGQEMSQRTKEHRLSTHDKHGEVRFAESNRHKMNPVYNKHASKRKINPCQHSHRPNRIDETLPSSSYYVDSKNPHSTKTQRANRSVRRGTHRPRILQTKTDKCDNLVDVGDECSDASNNKFTDWFRKEEDPRKTEARFYGGVGSPRFQRYEKKNAEAHRPFKSPSNARDKQHSVKFETEDVPHYLADSELLGLSTNDEALGRRLMDNWPLPFGTFKALSALLESPVGPGRLSRQEARSRPVFVAPHDVTPLNTHLKPFVPYTYEVPNVFTYEGLRLEAVNAKVDGEDGPRVRHPPVQFKPNAEKDTTGPLSEPFEHPGIVWPLAFASAPPYSTPAYEGGGVKQPVGVIQTKRVPARPLSGRAWELQTELPAWVSPLYSTYGVGGPYGRHGPFNEPEKLAEDGPWDDLIRRAEALGALNVPGVVQDNGKVDLSGLCGDLAEIKIKEALRQRDAASKCKLCQNFQAFVEKIRIKLGFKPRHKSCAAGKLKVASAATKTEASDKDDKKDGTKEQVEAAKGGVAFAGNDGVVFEDNAEVADPVTREEDKTIPESEVNRVTEGAATTIRSEPENQPEEIKYSNIRPSEIPTSLISGNSRPSDYAPDAPLTVATTGDQSEITAGDQPRRSILKAPKMQSEDGELPKSGIGESFDGSLGSL